MSIDDKDKEFYIKYCRKIQINPNYLYRTNFREIQNCGCKGEYAHSTYELLAVDICDKHIKKLEEYKKEMKRRFVVVNHQGYYLKQRYPDVFTKRKDLALKINIDEAKMLNNTSLMHNCFLLEVEEK